MKLLKGTNTTKTYIGDYQGEKFYLYPPSFDCNWYWSFCHIGNRTTSMHISSIKQHNKNIYDSMVDFFGDSLRITKKDLWTFCEIVQTLYTLKDTASIFHIGGSHMTSNPLAARLKSQKENSIINSQLIPELLLELSKVMALFPKKEKAIHEIENMLINEETSTPDIITFMISNNIHPDDIKDFSSRGRTLSKDDTYILTIEYWKRFHKK